MKAPAFSIWSSFYYDLSPEDMVITLEERGMTVCELSDEHAVVLLERGDPKEIGEAFAAFAKEHHVSFPQGHLWMTVHLCDQTKDVIGTLHKWISLFSAIGIRNAVLHCDDVSFAPGTPKEEILSANVRVLKALAPIAEENHVRLCLENLPGIFNEIENLLFMIDAVGSPALGICLDTGHLHLDHPNGQEAFILAAGERLHALHIADNEGYKDQHLMPFGRGNIDFASVMRGLAAIGYRDLFNYEIPGENRAPLSVRKAKNDYLKTVTEALYAQI